jgi:hypothetical protein
LDEFDENDAFCQMEDDPDDERLAQLRQIREDMSRGELETEKNNKVGRGVRRGGEGRVGGRRNPTILLVLLMCKCVRVCEVVCCLSSRGGPLVEKSAPSIGRNLHALTDLMCATLLLPLSSPSSPLLLPC